MATYRQKLEWWDGYRCNRTDLVDVNVLGRYPVRIQRPAVNALYALDAVLRATGYPMPTGPTGSYNCRKIGGSDLWSLHAYGIAVDIDYANNPYIRGDTLEPGWGTDPRWRITEAQVDAVLSITNSEGGRLWKWLGYGMRNAIDPMHFEIDQPPHLCQPKGTPMEYRGVLNVPDAQWARDVVDWGIQTGVIETGDTFVDDWARDEMTDGRFWTFLKRYDDYLERKWS